MNSEHRTCGRNWLGSAYFVDGVDNSSRILPPELQSDFPIPLGINQIGYQLVTGGFQVPRSEALPLSEDGMFYEDGLLTMGSRG